MSKLPIPRTTTSHKPFIQTGLTPAQQRNSNSHFHERGPVIDQLTPEKMKELRTGLQAYQTRIKSMPNFDSNDEEEIMLTIREASKYGLAENSLSMSVIWEISASEAPFTYDNTEDLRYIYLQTLATIIANINAQLDGLPDLSKSR